MSEHRINKIRFKVLNPKINMWVSLKELPGYRKKNLALFEAQDIKSQVNNQNEIYVSFEPHSEAYEIELNLELNKYFLKPYIEHQFCEYFQRLGFAIRIDFINNIQLWKYLCEKYSHKVFERFSIRQLTTWNLQDLELLVSYDGKSFVSGKPLSLLSLHSEVNRYFQDNNILETRKNPITDKSGVYPILSTQNKKELGIPFEGYANRNTYLEYYNKISKFSNEFLLNKTIGNNIQVISNSFDVISANRIYKTKRVSNSLKFNGESDFNINNGLKKHGPYKVPNTENLRFIFIFKQKHRDYANKLYSAFKNGISDNIPGLHDYIKINFVLAKQSKIVLDDNNSVEDFEKKLRAYQIEDGIRYFAIYLTEHKKHDIMEEHDEEYYRIKYLLLQKEILSQFIYFENIQNSSFKFHLPNIAVAILAKLGGIPWKLDTIGSSNLIIGFGVRRLNNNVYLGNTLCFRDDGEFYQFETYQKASIQTIGEALQNSIQRMLTSELLSPDKLIIHYYKTLSEEEAVEIERVLDEVDLKIPFVVVTINDTKSKDYLFFDVTAKGIMPVSGTVVELKNKAEYLLANNQRYNETQSYGINKYPFPLKIKINKPKNPLYDVFDINDLIDQIYSFSRIYWKSISQISLPVTIAYSKIVADLAAHFPEHSLPDKTIAHSNLWFL